ncbi:hypothetical protein GCM10007962_30760 [Yeosuana aromativorans]|uniref:Glycoside hydrolase family 42 N-terminal domain-containing protein n=1 Tax=Yeosuana aromativorans TaxID=288019 RepID=A0A8J3BTC1_9FLAO|nr:hypothetical protein [Yeosuana aromativorans]GGK34174.1 hypothetical protein GCM10007962_30760 [Yeosuana aromativorans]
MKKTYLFVTTILFFATIQCFSGNFVLKTFGETHGVWPDSLLAYQEKVKEKKDNSLKAQKDATSIYVEYIEMGKANNTFIKLPEYDVNFTKSTKITRFKNNFYQVVLKEIDKGNYTEINGELENLSDENSCITLRIIIPLQGNKWKWFSGLEKEYVMSKDSIYSDTKKISTMLPPDGAFNGQTLSDGGYGDSVGQGSMSFYPLGVVSVDNSGEGLGVDMTLPIVYRLSAKKNEGLIAEFDIATSPLTEKFPNRAFFKLSHFNFNSNWGMRAALKQYYSIYPESFKKRVTTEGIWLPFTPLRSIKNWKDFGFAFHELSWNSFDVKEGKSIPSIVSDKGTGVLSFQYTEPWDIQLPILRKNIPYDTLVSNRMVPQEHQQYLKNSATEDKNGLWQTRRLETPWFSSGWAVSITTNCNPDIEGFNRYQYVRQTEIAPALKMNVDGVYFDSMEWNWHYDLNYRIEQFKYTDYPLSFSKNVARPAIWNFVSEFEFMKKIADEMHSQGKLVMGNGHAWNPFAAANLDLFGAELSWYSTGDHGIEALDFKRAISSQKPIVFLLNEGLNDKAFTNFPFKGYEIYFEKLLAYGFFPSFFSTDASSDPYWMDAEKVENGRPFFKKYIPIIKQISAAGWEPVTDAVCDIDFVRIERFGERGELFFTIRNNGNKDASCTVTFDLKTLGISRDFKALEVLSGMPLKVKNDELNITVPTLRTQVIKIIR